MTSSNDNAIALASFKKRDYVAAIPLYEACLLDAKKKHGDFSVEVLSSMDKLAIFYSETNQYDKAIRVNKERFKKISLLYGDSYPPTLSALYSLARDYFNQGDFGKALSLHKDCFEKRCFALGVAHKMTLESKAAVYSIQTSIFNKKKVKELIGLFNELKVKELIELIDRRKLNRTGLLEKSELAQLLDSNAPNIEIRGVTIKLFKAIRQLALSINSDSTFWTIARVSVMICGNHEILKSDCRFGIVDPVSTLTFAYRCSLIDVLLRRHFDSNNKHPILNLSYKEAVGEKANLLISFAYGDNFIETVDALEVFLEKNSKQYPEDTTYFWFDPFVNDQWTTSSMPFEFWVNIFYETVSTIGHTLCLLSPWDDPSYVGRVWCLLEMRFSPRVSLVLSRKEQESFIKALRIDFDSIIASLCRIKVENASSFLPEDRERIFEIIDSMEGGVDGFNNFVLALIREWISNTATEFLSIAGNKNNEEEYLDLCKCAKLHQSLGKLDRAIHMLRKAMVGFERSVGPHHKSTLTAARDLGCVLQIKGDFKEGKLMFERVIKWEEQDIDRQLGLSMDQINLLKRVAGLFDHSFGRHIEKVRPILIRDWIASSVGIDSLSLFCSKNEANLTKDELDYLCRASSKLRRERSRPPFALGIEESADDPNSPVEVRGVKLALLQSVRDLAVVINSDPTYWSMDRVCNLIIGHKDILPVPNMACRFGEGIDPTTTLTCVYGKTCSLIDMLRRDHSRDRHPLLNISYDEAVGAKANRFISFPYADNFMELVDALELLSCEDPNNFHPDTTFYWFDMFVNNNWKSADRDFKWWTELFSNAVTQIGHTVCFMSSWNNPTLAGKAWCLYEISCSERISIALSKKQRSNFQRNLRFDLVYGCDNRRSSLSSINLANATCRKDKDRQQIFQAVELRSGGIQGFNDSVVSLIRDWFVTSMQTRIAPYISDSKTDLSDEQLDDIDYTATLLFEQGEVDKGKVLYNIAIGLRERIAGRDHKDTLRSMSNLGNLLLKHGCVHEAKGLLEKVISSRERTLGPHQIDTLSSLANLGCLLQCEGNCREAREMFERVLIEYERTLGREHLDTLNVVHNLAKVVFKLGQQKEAKELWERALQGFERLLGPYHEYTKMASQSLADNY